MSDRDKSASREAGSQHQPITNAVYSRTRGKSRKKESSPRIYLSSIESQLAPEVAAALRQL